MQMIENIAKNLNIEYNELVHYGIKSYLQDQLKFIDIELYTLSKKFGVKDINTFLEKIEDGSISEDIAYDDFFLFDNLTARRESIVNSLSEL
jgi:hypothetical protein